MPDLEAATRTYADDYGIGPWDIHEFDPANVNDLREYAQPVERSWRLAVDETFAAQAERGHGVVLSGEFDGIRVAYLSTDQDLGVIIEIFSGTNVTEQEPESTQER